MDRVTKSYLQEFREEQSLSNDLPDSDLFEYFADYCVVSIAHEEEFDTADVHVGGEDDLGIDGLAIVVNGVLVSSEGYAKLSLKKYSPIAARNDDLKVFRGRR